MKKHLAVLAVVAVGLFTLHHFPPKAVAAEYNIGTIASPDGGSFNNSTTATSFPLPTSHRYAFTCTAAVYFNWSMTSTGTVTSTTGIPVSANTLQDTASGVRLVYLNIIPQSGTASCYVFDVASW